MAEVGGCCQPRRAIKEKRLAETTALSGDERRLA